MWKSYDSQYFQVVDYENLQFGLLLAKKNSNKIMLGGLNEITALELFTQNYLI